MAKDFINTLYYGDNLDILKRHVARESVDLVYLDPPFNSNADYNVLFAEHEEKSHAQIKAFGDTWTWDTEAARNFNDAITNGGENVAACMQAFQTLLGTSDMLAYLAMMAPRIVQLRRVLKATGSIYLHCDTTASHFLKILMDAVFGPPNFCNEIIWRRTGAHNSTRSYGRIHDVILFYAKSNEHTFNIIRRPYMKGHVEGRYTKQADGRMKFTSGGNVLTGAGAVPDADSGRVWRGFNPTAKGRHWAIPTFYEAMMPDSYKNLNSIEKLDALYAAGLVEIDGKSAWPIMVRYLDERDGMPLSDIWAAQPYTEGTLWGTDEVIDADVQWMGPTDPDRLGYQTQKPDGLLERIIRASSNEGDIVLDPFCGCGTTIAAAQKLNRRWLGIDITHLAINLIKSRLSGHFRDRNEKNEKFEKTYRVVGEPEDYEGARQLAEQDKYQFQYWALGLIGARPLEEKKGADKGIDGRLRITEGDGTIKATIIISVKGGGVTVNQVRDLVGTLNREKAAIGVFICLEDPTKPMREEAAAAGMYTNKTLVGESVHPRIQIVTIAELLKGKRLDLPYSQSVTQYKQAAKVKKEKTKNLDLPF